MVLFGIGFYHYSDNIPYYINDTQATTLNRDASDIPPATPYQKRNTHQNHKIYLMDWSSGIIVFSSTLLLLVLLTRIKSIRDLGKFTTLSRNATITSANIVWLLMIPGTYFYYRHRAIRGDYPPWADTIMIPIFSQSITYLVLMIPLNIFLNLMTRNAPFPVKLFNRPTRYDRIAILWELFFGFLLAINLFLIFECVRDGDHASIPITMFFTFIFLSLRAGRMALLNTREQPSFH